MKPKVVYAGENGEMGMIGVINYGDPSMPIALVLNIKFDTDGDLEMDVLCGGEHVNINADNEQLNQIWEKVKPYSLCIPRFFEEIAKRITSVYPDGDGTYGWME